MSEAHDGGFIAASVPVRKPLTVLQVWLVKGLGQALQMLVVFNL